MLNSLLFNYYNTARQAYGPFSSADSCAYTFITCSSSFMALLLIRVLKKFGKLCAAEGCINLSLSDRLRRQVRLS